MTNPEKKQSVSILIVDDEPANIQLLANVLTEEGYAIEFAMDGEQALIWAKSKQFDLILLDIMMPGMSGYKVCQKIRENPETGDTPIIFLTAKTDSESVVKGFGVGAMDYITKPFNKAELLARVHTHLKIGELQRALQKSNEELEQRVEERTRELSLEVKERKKAQEELIQMNTAYKRFVPHEFLSLLDKESILDVQLGDQVQKHMSVLFSDIRSFTLLSEQMTPEENFQFVNTYLNKMGPLVRKHHGFIDKFIGDAIMALFHGTADDALRSAIAMFQTLKQYNEERETSGSPSIEVGIAINTGMMMLGTLGEHDRMDSTVISDAVNLAARLEGLTKFYHVSLLISEYTFQQLKDPDQYSIRFLDRVKVKGKTEAVAVYEVYDPDDAQTRSEKQKTAKIFEKACQCYQEKDLTQAKSLFEECLRQNPEDKTTQVFINSCDQLSHPTIDAKTDSF